MVGTGVFTSLGFQVVDIKSGFSILLLWTIGGIVAFCGATAYAELGSVFKRSGGEYNILKEAYHPALGFIAGWVSVTVGFAAPASLAAMALGSYLKTLIPNIPENHVAAATVLILSSVHASSVKLGSKLQNGTTALKIALIIIFIIAGFGIEVSQPISILPAPNSWKEIISGPFAISLVYVAYAYTGWNSSIYIVDEIDNPRKLLPKSLFAGTAIVTILYVLLNYVFLFTVPIDVLAGQIEVGFLSGNAIFGEVGGTIMAIAISLLLVSTVSAYVFLGPRVSGVMGQDFKALKFLSKTSDKGIPVNAFWFSTALSLLFIYTSTFEQVLVYTSFLLILITTLAVAAVFVVRFKGLGKEGDYRTWGYPFTPSIFLGVSFWMLIFVAMDKPFESMISCGILVTGFLIYYFVER